MSKKIKKQPAGPTEQEYYDRARRDLFPKVRESAISLHINSKDPDPKICMELGAMILFDKPIIVLVRPDEPVSANLRRVASAIVEGDENDPTLQNRLQKTIKDVLEGDRRTKTSM